MAKKVEYKEDVLRRLRQIREKLGYTQNEMAKHMHLKRTTYSSIEQGHNSLIERHVLLLQEKLNVNPDFLIHGIGEMFLEDAVKAYREVEESIDVYEREKVINLEKENRTLREEIEMYKGIIKKMLKE